MRVAPDDTTAETPDAPAAPAPVVAPVVARPPAPPPAPAPVASTSPAFVDPFDDLVADVASAIASSVPSWRVQVGEAAARWQAEGIATGVLERALRLTQAPDVDGLLAAFAAAVGRLRSLEREAVALDASVAGRDVFRDPARAAEAQALVEALRRPRPPARPPLRVDAESWVADWPDVVALLIEGP